MNFEEKRRAQLNITSLGDMIRSGQVSTKVDPEMFVHGPEDMDCLVSKWARKEVMGIIAGSGAGKSTITLYMQIEILKNNPDEIAIFVSLEMATQKIAEKLVRICQSMDRMDILDRFFVVSNFDEDGKTKMLNSDDIIREANVLRHSLGKEICCMAVDHLHIMHPTKSQGQDLNKMCQSVKDMAMELNTFIILLSQTTKGKSGSFCEKPLDADASFNCSQFKWICSFVITIHQPIAPLFDTYKLPILAWAYGKVRDKHIDDKATVGVFKLLRFNMETDTLRPVTANEMLTFGSAYAECLALKADENDDGAVGLYDTKINGRSLSDRDMMLGDTFNQPTRPEKPETDEQYAKRTSGKTRRRK